MFLHLLGQFSQHYLLSDTPLFHRFVVPRLYHAKLPCRCVCLWDPHSISFSITCSCRHCFGHGLTAYKFQHTGARISPFVYGWELNPGPNICCVKCSKFLSYLSISYSLLILIFLWWRLTSGFIHDRWMLCQWTISVALISSPNRVLLNCSASPQICYPPALASQVHGITARTSIKWPFISEG